MEFDVFDAIILHTIGPCKFASYIELSRREWTNPLTRCGG
jgi:predicted nucleotide-binding protein (sugar kinase/HSP70/actin superfamily)